MGYRTKIGCIPKSEREQYRGKTPKEVSDMMTDNCSPHYPPNHVDFGEFNSIPRNEMSLEEFYDFDCYAEYESEYWICSKEDYKKIIEYNRRDLASWLAEIAERDEKSLKSYILSRSKDWQDNAFDVKPYFEIDSDNNSIVRSWSTEYQMFNLVYWGKHFDWDNNYMIVSAW